LSILNDGFNIILSLIISKFYYSDLIIFHLFYLTNLDLFLFLILIFIIFLIKISIYDNKLICQEIYQNNIESLFEWVINNFNVQNGLKGQMHFSIYLTIFFFILVSNILGMIPFSFTITSHIFQTFSLGLAILISLTVLAILRNGISWFKLFLPKVPIFILPLFIFIETVSYISRAFSLSIRLFANLMSGHTLLHILTGFIIKIGSNSFFFLLIAIIPFILITAIVLLELLIAFLQAYVFVTLFTVYLNDSYTRAGH